MESQLMRKYSITKLIPANAIAAFPWLNFASSPTYEPSPDFNNGDPGKSGLLGTRS